MNQRRIDLYLHKGTRQVPTETRAMNDPLPAAVAIGDAVLFQELEDEVVLLNMSSQQYYGLNDVGASMWKSLMEVRNVATAGDLLSKEYAVEPAVLRADLETLVRDLLKAGLLKAELQS